MSKLTDRLNALEITAVISPFGVDPYSETGFAVYYDDNTLSKPVSCGSVTETGLIGSPCFEAVKIEVGGYQRAEFDCPIKAAAFIVPLARLIRFIDDYDMDRFMVRPRPLYHEDSFPDNCF